MTSLNGGLSAVSLDEASGSFESTRVRRLKAGSIPRPRRANKIAYEFFDDLRSTLLEELTGRRGMHLVDADAHCAHVGIAVWNALRGNGHVYFPTGKFIDVEARQKAIVSEFVGNNAAVLARKHKTSVINVYRVLEAARKSRIVNAAKPNNDDRPGLDLLYLFQETVAHALLKRGMQRDAAAEIGVFARDKMREVWGGVQLLIGDTQRMPEWMESASGAGIAKGDDDADF